MRSGVRPTCAERAARLRADRSQVEIAKRHDVRALGRGTKGRRQPVCVVAVFAVCDGGSGDDVGGEHVDVIRAHEVQREVEEREVEQALEDLAFDDFVGRAADPDRLSHPASPARRAQASASELVPDREDAPRVLPDGCHVREGHAFGRRPELGLQRSQPGLGKGDEHGVLSLGSLTHERDHAREEVVLTFVEERFMSKPAHAEPRVLEMATTFLPENAPVKRVRS